MPNAFNLIEYRYHAVGQGLFTSGALIKQGHLGPRFRWVYDCGTSSSQQLIVDEIDRMPWLHGRPNSRLDMVVISHFDADHISGLVELVGRFPIGTLLLPYASLAARLIAAFEQGVSADSPVFRLFVDPVGYILAQDGGERIGRIVLVPPSDGEGAPPPPDEPDEDVEPPRPDGEEGELELRIDADEIDPTAAAEMMIQTGPTASVEVKMLRQGGRIWLDAMWEFVPYNNAELAPPDLDDFRNEVVARRDALLRVGEAWRHGRDLRNEKACLSAIEELKLYYDLEIGARAKERNLISLFLYSGPLFKPPSPAETVIGIYAYSRDWGYRRHYVDRFAQLFSGDGYLNNDRRFSDLEKHISRRRLDRVGVFQVMHHGARANWHKGVAAKLKPKISVFSSDPNRGNTYHPHAEVLRDFWPFCAVQVDDTSGLDVTMYFDR